MLVKSISKFLFFIFISLFLVSSVHALDVPAPDGLVRDDANILTGYETQLEQHLQQFEKDTTVQIAILTIPSLEGEDPAQYSGNVFDTWKIGQADVDNGLLILIAAGDREYFFQTGYGLEGTLPDIALGRMGRNILVPFFREEKYGEGINAVVNEMESYIRNDPGVVSKYSGDSSDGVSLSSSLEFELFGLGFFMVAIWIILLIGVVGKAYIQLKGESNRMAQTVQQGAGLFLMSGWLAIFAGFSTQFLAGGFYGFTLASAAMVFLLLAGKPPYFTGGGGSGIFLGGMGRGSGGFGGGGFSGGGGFGGGMSGGGGAGGKW